MPQDIRFLTLWLTDACNLQCRYCYRNESGKGQSMSCETVDQAIKWATASGKPFHVQLSGGEAALEPNLIVYIASRLRAAELPASIALQTNATMIDDQLVNIIKRFGIQVGVSLDGPPEVHDRLRGGFANTYHGLQKLAQHGIDFRVTTVICNENIEELDRLALLLAGFANAQGVGLDLLVNKGAAAANAVAPVPAGRLRNGIWSLMQILKMINGKRPSPIRLREMDKLSGNKKRHSSRDFCHACRGESLAVHPDGRVYPCGQTIGDERFAAGTIDSPVWEKLNLLMPDNKTPSGNCRKCPIFGCCPGDCPSRGFYNDKKGTELFCTLYQTIWHFMYNDRDSVNSFKGLVNKESRS